MDTKTISATLAVLATLPLTPLAPIAWGHAVGPRPLPPAELDPELDPERWAEALSAPDLEARRQSYEELLEMAREDALVREEVSFWADSSSDVELAWNAELLLRELAAEERAERRNGTRGSAPRSPLGASPFPHALHRRGADPFDPLDMGWVEEMMQELRSGSGLHAPFGGRLGGGSSTGNSSRLSVGPDGVELEVEETIDGETTTRTYEAETLEELLETYPELEDEVSVELLDDPFEAFGGLRRLHPLSPGQGLAFPDPFGQRSAPRRPSLDVLGVRMIEPGRREQAYAGVDADIGLQVVEVVRGTLADAVGIRPGELVVGIAGQEIRSAADVRAALATQSLEREIEIECVDPDGTRRVRTWTPAATDDAGTPGHPGDFGARLKSGSKKI